MSLVSSYRKCDTAGYCRLPSQLQAICQVSSSQPPPDIVQWRIAGLELGQGSELATFLETDLADGDMTGDKNNVRNLLSSDPS